MDFEQQLADARRQRSSDLAVALDKRQQDAEAEFAAAEAWWLALSEIANGLRSSGLALTSCEVPKFRTELVLGQPYPRLARFGKLFWSGWVLVGEGLAIGADGKSWTTLAPKEALRPLNNTSSSAWAVGIRRSGDPDPLGADYFPRWNQREHVTRLSPVPHNARLKQGTLVVSGTNLNGDYTYDLLDRLAAVIARIA